MSNYVKVASSDKLSNINNLIIQNTDWKVLSDMIKGFIDIIYVSKRFLIGTALK